MAILVYGDVMLDEWRIGSVDRISPEAPVPVLVETGYKRNVGGAGNLAVNLASINGEVDLYGPLGNDKQGFAFLDLIKDTKVNSYLSSCMEATTSKVRIVSTQGQQICRFDTDAICDCTQAEERFINSIQHNDLVVISDYNKGAITEQTVKKAKAKGAKVLVDPKQSPSYYRGAFLVKPNMKEYTEWFGEFSYVAAQDFLKEYAWEWLVVTDGANGIHIVNATEHWHCKEDVQEVADVSGAGDTVMAIITHGLHKGKSVPESCEVACYGASRVVEKRGVTIVTEDDLNKGIVWTNGVFDILHTGHLKLLRYAATLGKRLIVGINSDASVKRLKGETRPINSEFKRKETLEQLGFIDDVVIFDGDTPIDEITKIRPDVIVKGGDYTTETTVGNELAKVVIFPTIEGHSTTETIEKIKQ
tara:strand:- start:50213 stop:51463 length:1251 start_codon:yes stop_codon:yes gene_type:complete